MIGTFVNVAAIIIGSFLGLLLKKWIKKEYCDQVLKVIGIAVMAISICGLIKSMITVDENHNILTHYELEIIIILSIGTLIGELLKIDDRLNLGCTKIEKHFIKNENKQGDFVKGFITSSLVVCVGAMSLFGSISDALGDPTTLYLKSVIDFVTVIILASSLGIGVLFSSITVLIYQGIITILAIILGDFLTIDFINCFSALGYAMIMGIAANFIFDAKIKIANMLPSIVLLIGYYLIRIYLL